MPILCLVIVLFVQLFDRRMHFPMFSCLSLVTDYWLQTFGGDSIRKNCDGTQGEMISHSCSEIFRSVACVYVSLGSMCSTLLFERVRKVWERFEAPRVREGSWLKLHIYLSFFGQKKNPWPNARNDLPFSPHWTTQERTRTYYLCYIFRMQALATAMLSRNTALTRSSSTPNCPSRPHFWRYRMDNHSPLVSLTPI